MSKNTLFWQLSVSNFYIQCFTMVPDKSGISELPQNIWKFILSKICLVLTWKKLSSRRCQNMENPHNRKKFIPWNITRCNSYLQLQLRWYWHRMDGTWGNFKSSKTSESESEHENELGQHLGTPKELSMRPWLVNKYQFSLDLIVFCLTYGFKIFKIFNFFAK